MPLHARTIDTILVANRGEIALRIMRTARRMGLGTVAVYSEPDADQPHALSADRAVCIGPAAALESYLNIAKLIDAAKRTGAQAVHPGYGFVSESEAFAAACADAGLIFIGPSPRAIRAMGNKVTAKEVMRRCGVPCVPGYDGTEQDDRAFTREAGRIGYPVIVKPIAGGGGKGMRLVESEAQLPEALLGARSEALKSFGDGTLMLEQAIVGPRHVEVQVFGDVHGNIVHLGDRDCSIQRRHQKIIEEAPAPGLAEVLHRRMGEAAIKAAAAVNYEGAGTVEFLVTPDGEFFFLEMNTRLQVEHAVTEMVTGLDLVEWQIRVARGEPLPRKQEQVRLSGHAIEVRIYAEDPAAKFLPQSGQITIWQIPQGEGIRVEHGLGPAAKVSTWYDPMIAKIIAHGPDREAARSRLVRATERFAIGGVRNNLAFLKQCLLHPAFVQAKLDTGFLDRANLEHALILRPEREIVAIAAALFQSRALDSVDPSLRHWRSRPWRAQRLSLECGEWTGTVAVAVSEQSAILVHDGDAGTEVKLLSSGERTRLRVDAIDQAVHVAWSGDSLDLVRDGMSFRFREARNDRGSAAAAGTALVYAPMPGSIVEIRVAPGSDVVAGDVLLIIEAMKMELQIQAPISGRIASVDIAIGEQVGMRQTLVHIVAAAEAGISETGSRRHAHEIQ